MRLTDHSPDFTAPEPKLTPPPRDEAAREDAKMLDAEAFGTLDMEIARIAGQGRMTPENAAELEAAKAEPERGDKAENAGLSVLECVMGGWNDDDETGLYPCSSEQGESCVFYENVKELYPCSSEQGADRGRCGAAGGRYRCAREETRGHRTNGRAGKGHRPPNCGKRGACPAADARSTAAAVLNAGRFEYRHA